MAQQRESNRNYLVGPLVFELGLALPAHAEFQAACRPPLTRVAERFNACAVLYLRSGVDWVCAARAGPSVYGGSILEVGTRRPLLSAVGGAAILMALAPAEAHAIVAQNKKQLKRLSDASLLRLEKFVERSASQGFAFAQGEVSKGVHTFGIPLCDEHEQPFGSLALAGSADEFPASRARAVIEVLRAEAQTIASELQRVFLVR